VWTTTSDAIADHYLATTATTATQTTAKTAPTRG